jgi:hypothetical protein
MNYLHLKHERLYGNISLRSQVINLEDEMGKQRLNESRNLLIKSLNAGKDKPASGKAPDIYGNEDNNQSQTSNDGSKTSDETNNDDK